MKNKYIKLVEELIKENKGEDTFVEFDLTKHYNYILVEDGWMSHGYYVTCFVIDIINKEIISWIRYDYPRVGSGVSENLESKFTTVVKKNMDFYTYLDNGIDPVEASLKIGKKIVIKLSI